jgi:hypothetical protein
MRKHPIVKKLAEERRISGRRLDDLSRDIGRCQSLMEKYEYGARYPTFPVILAWADVLGFELTLTRKDPDAKPKIKYLAPPITKVCKHCKKRFGPRKYEPGINAKRPAVESPGRFNKRKFCTECKHQAQNYRCDLGG